MKPDFDKALQGHLDAIGGADRRSQDLPFAIDSTAGTSER